MTTTFLNQRNELSAKLSEWWPILLGLLALYIPTYYALSTTLWNNDDQAHGPIVLMVVLFLIWQNRETLKPNPSIETWPVLGGLSLGLGLLFYMLGRSQDIFLLDIGSQIPVLAGILLLTRGMPALRAMWFPLFFILFMIPLPGILVDAITLPMKMAVSYVAESVLFWFGYPIARAGVILQIGQYQLLVADACAGMHTLVSLEALGLLYLNLVKHNSLFRNITLAILIIPISFTANVIRVMVLTLVTYYFGDEAGQGFVHGFAGMVLFVVALVLIMGVDSFLQYFVTKRRNHNVLTDAKVAQ
ncbi:MAG: exosortase B [Methylotenera sp.]